MNRFGYRYLQNGDRQNGKESKRRRERRDGEGLGFGKSVVGRVGGRRFGGERRGEKGERG